jgi:glucokinase
MDAASVALAVDLGGTNLRGALVSADGVIQHEEQVPTQAADGPDAVIQRIADTIGKVVAATGAPDDVAIGVAAPGPLNPRTGIVYFCPNLPGWHDTPLRERLEALTQRKVLIGNDANAAALGEHYFGSRKGVRNLIYVGLGTGVGGGVVSEGELIDGAQGMGAELGHTTVNFEGPRCHCGGVGCIEAYCSAWALTYEAERLVNARRGEGLLAAAAGQPVGPRAIGDAARAGDVYALRLLERAGTALGAGLANFVNIFNPEVIVIGGGVAELGEPLFAPVRRALRAYGLPGMTETVEVTGSALSVKSGIYGAAALVFHAERA